MHSTTDNYSLPPMKVLISGAGIAGPTLAYFLSQSTELIEITIVEKAPHVTPFGQNIDISGSAIRVIERMHLLSEVRRFNTGEQGTQFISPNGSPYARFPMVRGTRASFTSEFEILRGDLAHVLYEATKSLKNVTYRFNTTITNVLENYAHSGVTVELSDSTKERYDVLVAADGQWSRLRKLCFAPQDVTLRDLGPYSAYWAIPRSEKDGDNDWWNIYTATGSRVFSLRPDPHGTIRAGLTIIPHDPKEKKTWEAASRPGATREQQEALIVAHFGDAGWQMGRMLEGMSSAPDFYFHAVQQVRMKTWSMGRVVCLGDAAYCPSPMTGMGTSLALIGAYVLAGEILTSKDNEGLQEGLRMYQEQLRPFVEKVQDVPGWMPRIMHPRRRWTRALLRGVIRMLALVVKVPWLVKKLEPNSEEEFPLPDYEALGEAGKKGKEEKGKA